MASDPRPDRTERRAVPRTPDGKPQTSARFIPREELGSFSAWTPNSLSGAPQAEPPLTRRAAAAPEAPAAAPAAEDPAALLRAARQAGYQDGYRDGLVALESFKQSYATQVTTQVGQLVAALGSQLDALQAEMAQALAATAAQLARQVVRSELAVRPELVAHVAEQAIETLLLTARHITLRVHPEDHALVAAGAGDALAARGARLVADPAIDRGGCLVESDLGAVDASIETRWRQAGGALGSETPWADAGPDEGRA